MRRRFKRLGLLALAVVTGIQTVGVLLTNALLITPAAALLSDRMLLGVAFRAASLFRSALSWRVVP